MGWGIIIKEVYLNRVHKDKQELENFKREYEDDIRRVREDLLMFAAATPRDVADVEGNPMKWEEYVHSEIENLMAELEEAQIRLFLIDHALSDMDNIETDY